MHVLIDPKNLSASRMVSEISLDAQHAILQGELIALRTGYAAADDDLRVELQISGEWLALARKDRNPAWQDISATRNEQGEVVLSANPE